jgi:phosphate-selective porin OprO/OprP
MFKRKILTIAVTTLGGLLSLAPPAAGAKTRDGRVDVLETRIRELEAKLEKALTASAEKQATSPASDLKKIDQKVRLIERKLEVEKEVSDGKWAKLPKVEVGARGLNVESQDGDFIMNLRGTIQADSDFFIDDSRGNPTNTNGDNLADRFFLRRVRPTFTGTFFKYVDWRIMPDFAGGQTRLFDAYADLRYFREASLAAGKFKAPVSLERLQSASALTFTERAFPTQLAPNRDIGFMLHGEFDPPGGPATARSYNLYQFPEFLVYQVGVFDGSRNNGNIDSDANDSKEFQGRIFAHPFQGSGYDALEGLGVGVAGTWGQPNDDTLSTYTTAGQQTMFRYLSAARADGNHYRVYPQMYWLWGPFGLIGEYVVSNQDLVNQSVQNTPDGPRTKNRYQINETDYAWNVTASYVLTGEDNVFQGQGIRPRHGFDPFAGRWGAFQIAARWTEIHFGEDVFQNVAKTGSPVYTFADPRQSVQSATEWSLGVNWWLNPNVKLMADYSQTYFDGGAGVYDAKGKLTNQVMDRETEKVFITRVQVAF